MNKKRVVILIDKQTGQKTPFPSVSALVNATGKEVIGIRLNALYNALSHGKGKFENHKVQIYYKTIEIQPKAWL